MSSGSGAFSRSRARCCTGHLRVLHPCGARAKKSLRFSRCSDAHCGPEAGALVSLAGRSEYGADSSRPLTTGSAAGLAQQRHTDFHRSRTVDWPTPAGVGFVATRRCAIASKDADLRSPEQEAQALTLEQIREELPDGARMEWATVRNGDVVETGRVEIPDEYYTAAAGSAIECLMTARNTVLHERPRIRANSIVSMLIADGLLKRDDAQHAVALIEVNLRKQVEELYEAGRAELSGRFPLLLRTLIPLIRRSFRKS